MKKILFSKLFIFLLGVVVTSTSIVFASNYIASDIAYTPKDSNWHVSNVAEAINSIELSKTSDNYSIDERIVGTWIDGKPIYRKMLYPNSTYVDDNVEKLVDIKIYFHANDQQEVANPCYVNGDFRAMGYYIESTKSIKLVNSSGTTIDYLFVQYTKTTDNASNS